MSPKPPPPKGPNPSAVRPVAPHVQRAVAAPLQAKLQPPAASGRQPAAHVRAAASAVQAKPAIPPGSGTIQETPGWALGLGLAGAAVGGFLAAPWIVTGAAIGGAIGATVGAFVGNEPAAPGPVPAPVHVPLTNRVFAQDPVGRGGSYGQMKALSARNVREADHTPPKSTYRGTPYAWVTENNMPAVSIPYVVHRRGQGGAGGGVTTTGSSRVVVHYREHHIRAHLLNNDFKQAMIVAFDDQKNAAPNPLYLVSGQREAAEYAHSIGLLTNDRELAEVIAAVERITY